MAQVRMMSIELLLGCMNNRMCSDDEHNNNIVVGLREFARRGLHVEYDEYVDCYILLG